MKSQLTPQQKKYICKHYLSYTDKQMAAYLGVSKTMVVYCRKINNLAIPKEVTRQRRAASMTGRTTATALQDAYLRQHYLSQPVKHMATQLAKSHTFVITRLRQLCLVIPEDIIVARKKASQIKKGSVPPNKGRKQAEYMSAEAIARTALTRFKPGQRSHNERKDGDICSHKDKCGRAYLYIRQGKANWLPLHRVVWQEQHGPIPKDKIIAIKDGDSTNCHIDNLEIICRTQNMLKNSRHHFPSEVIPTLTLINKIKRKINEKQTNKPQRHPIRTAGATK